MSCAVVLTLAAFAPAASSANAAETATATAARAWPRHCPWGTHWDPYWHRCVRDRGHGHGGWGDHDDHGDHGHGGWGDHGGYGHHGDHDDHGDHGHRW